MKTESDKILDILRRLEDIKNIFAEELTLATALEYGRNVRNETLDEAANKVKALSSGLDCPDCDSCIARKNDVTTILEMRACKY